MHFRVLYVTGRRDLPTLRRTNDPNLTCSDATSTNKYYFAQQAEFVATQVMKRIRLSRMKTPWLTSDQRDELI